MTHQLKNMVYYLKRGILSPAPPTPPAWNVHIGAENKSSDGFSQQCVDAFFPPRRWKKKKLILRVRK